jgi:hypothetical protein
MSFISKAVGWLFGSTGTAEKALDLADKAIDTSQERSERDTQDLDSARQFAGVSGQPGFVNQLVDATNRLVRPGVTLWLVGGFIGWWTLPRAEIISEYWQNIFMVVLTFWFGGRAILKDLPSAIKLMRGK